MKRIYSVVCDCIFQRHAPPDSFIGIGEHPGTLPPESFIGVGKHTVTLPRQSCRLWKGLSVLPFFPLAEMLDSTSNTITTNVNTLPSYGH